MAAPAPTADLGPRGRHEPLFDVHPGSGASIEVFYADRALETFGRCGAGWFYWARRRGYSPGGPATGPFATSYAAYRHALDGRGPHTRFGGRFGGQRSSLLKYRN
jgi:hypothetical protein